MTKIFIEKVIYRLVNEWMSDQSLSAEDLSQQMDELAGILARVSRQLRNCNLVTSGRNTHSTPEICSHWHRVKSEICDVNHQDTKSQEHTNSQSDVTQVDGYQAAGNELA